MKSLLLLLGLLACDAHDGSFDAGVDATAANDAADCVFCVDGSAQADVQAPTRPSPRPAPAVACVEDAGEGGVECPLPTSICAAPYWLEYFDDGKCGDAGCEYAIHEQYCGEGYCDDGGCVIEHSTAPAP